MLEHKMYCRLAAELSKDWSKILAPTKEIGVIYGIISPLCSHMLGLKIIEMGMRWMTRD